MYLILWSTIMIRRNSRIKKIFFVTTLKKNLPDKELREHFARRGKADDYDKYCLRIEAKCRYGCKKIRTSYIVPEKFQQQSL